MTSETRLFELSARDRQKPQPVLLGVAASGRLNGVLFTLSLRQTYRNASTEALEVVYTFPLPAQAVVLGFASELNGERKEGRVVPAQIAEQRYEAALAQGDSPVMLESHAGGLHTVNLGAMAPGDEVVLEVRFAQILRFDQNRLRLVIPTTIAPRYGSATSAGLQPHQVPDVSLESEYPLTLSIEMNEAFRGATVSCPTHRYRVRNDRDLQHFELLPGALMDRDVVILVGLREPRPALLVQCADVRPGSAPYVQMAALQLPPHASRYPTALKMLVDCSGSMAGDSMTSAIAVLQRVLEGMDSADWVGLSRFGTHVQHLLQPAPCTRRKLREAASLCANLQADMGGTAMHTAMHFVFGQSTEGFEGKPDVLLITDGQIWEPELLKAAAQVGGHRIFVVGVGSSPADSGMRQVAEATGGACEFVTPGENVQAAAKRLIDRIHRRPWHRPTIDWGTEPLWQTALPESVAEGDTLIAFAGLAAPPKGRAVRLYAFGADGTNVGVAQSEATLPGLGQDIARVAAWHRWFAQNPTAGPSHAQERSGALQPTDAERQAAAIDYQLMTAHTKCVLVHPRLEDEKIAQMPNLYRVPSMLAAGWGGTSSVMAPSQSDFGGFAEFRCNIFGDIFGGHLRRSRAASPLAPEVPMSRESDPSSPLSVARHVTAVLTASSATYDLAMACQTLQMAPAYRDAIAQGMQLEGISESDVWLVLASWINEQWPGADRKSRGQILNRSLSQLDPIKVEALRCLFDRLLATRVPALAHNTRARRLAYSSTQAPTGS